jgi:hypothetical protein
MEALVKLARDNWHKPSGLIFSLILSFSISFAFISQFTISELVKIILYIIVFLTIIFFWFKNRRIRKRKKNKVGFVISIETFEEKEESKIKQDFIDTIKKIIVNGKVGSTFDVIIAPNHISKNIQNYDDAYKIRRMTDSHFVLFGRVRLRKIGGSNKHVINLEGLVSHRPLLDKTRNKFRKEFKELFPRNVNISEDDDILLFEFTSNWTVAAAKYVIGIAAGLSGDLNYAENLFNDLRENIKHLDHNFPIFKKLNDRIPKRLFEILKTKAGLAYDAYKTSKDEELLKLMKHNLDKIHHKFSNDYEVLLLNSIYYFLSEKNISQAITVLKKCKRNRNGTWRLNLAFLYAYQGNLKFAYKEYCLVQKMTVSDSVLLDVESFICDTLNSEPEKYQLHYCLGVVNLYLKGDLKQAFKDFEKFLSQIKIDEYSFEKNQVKNWIIKIKNNITNKSA